MAKQWITIALRADQGIMFKSWRKAACNSGSAKNARCRYNGNTEAGRNRSSITARRRVLNNSNNANADKWAGWKYERTVYMRTESAQQTHPRYLHGTEQIAGNYFMVNGRVMHLRIINSAMGRICGGVTYVTRYLTAFSNLIDLLSLPISLWLVVDNSRMRATARTFNPLGDAAAILSLCQIKIAKSKIRTIHLEKNF